jgi:protein-disulfide isomerase
LPEQGVSSLDKLRANSEADEAFLRCLDKLAAQGRRVGAKVGTNYAPAIFAKNGLAKGITNQQLVDAMERLFANNTIVIGPNPDVRPSKATQVILRKKLDEQGGA